MQRQLGVWPPLPPTTYLRKARPALPFPLGEPGCRRFTRARQALFHGVRALGLGPSDEVLMPAYHHGSEVEAMVAAGVVCRFYDATPTLEPDPGELEALLGPRVRALYLIHYLGFPQDAPRWLAWARQRDLLLVEDAAQAWLAAVAGRPLGSFGDLAVFCLYKTVGVPDGGVLVSSSPPEAVGGRRSGAYKTARRHAAWLISRSALLAAAGARLEGGWSPPEVELALGDPGAPPCAATDLLLPRLLDPDPAVLRRRNYRLLLDQLGAQVPPAFARLPEGASPFAFPVADDDKAGLLERLRGSGISPLDFWAFPHPALPAGRFPEAARLRTRVVGLPVHQELGPADLERIATAASPRRRGGGLAVEAPTGLDGLRDEWPALAERTRSVFKTWEWASTWWHHFGAGRRLELTAVRSGGELVGVLPLYLWRSRPLTVMRFLGHGPSDELGPICAPADRPAVARALRRTLAGLEWDVFVGEQLPADQDWGAGLGGRVLLEEGCPVLEFGDGGWEGFLRSRSANFRGQVGRRARRLAKERQVGYRLADGSRDLEDELDVLFRLHALRWAGGGSRFLADEAFHRAFAVLAQERGWLRLWFLEVEQRPVAALYGWRYAGTECYYQAGRDPAWDGWSVGFVLLAHAIRQAAQDGMCEYRLLRGGEEYKHRFATVDPGLHTIGVTRGLAAGAALQLVAAVRAARRGAPTAPAPAGARARGGGRVR